MEQPRILEGKWAHCTRCLHPGTVGVVLDVGLNVTLGLGAPQNVSWYFYQACIDSGACKQRQSVLAGC